jgi:hypothetical protein
MTAAEDKALAPGADLDLDEAGDLRLDGKVVRATRSFPWTAPDQFVTLRDAEGKEVATIADLAALPARSRGAVEAWLQRHTLVPKVLRVIEIEESLVGWTFHLETDRGDRRVVLKEREDLRTLDDGRLLLRDGDGQTYEFPPPEDLDVESRRELTQLV